MTRSNITIIITTFNDQPSVLYKAIDSCIEQTLHPKEIIVVDDGSKNASAKLVCEKIQELTDIPIKYLFQDNQGPSSARNAGLNLCATDYVCFLDSDDVMLPNNLSSKYEILKNLPDNYFGVYGSYINNPGGIYEHSDHDGKVNIDNIDQKTGFPGGCPTYLFNTKSIKNIGGFDITLKNHEDFDLIIRLILSGQLLKGSFGTGFIRNITNYSLSRSNDKVKLYSSINVFLRKAKKFNYFSNNVINDRYFLNEINVAYYYKQQKSFTKFIFHATKAFKYSKPKTLKQFLAYIITRPISPFIKIN